MQDAPRSPRKRGAQVPEGKLRKLSDHLKAGHKALSKSPLFSKKKAKGKRSPVQVDKELQSLLKKVRSKLQQAENLLKKSPVKSKKRRPKKAPANERAEIADDTDVDQETGAEDFEETKDEDDEGDAPQDTET